MTSSAGSAWNAAQSQVCTSPVSVVMRNSHEPVSTRGVGPADSTGKSVTRYWPGGSFSRPDRGRPLNPGDTMPMRLACHPATGQRQAGTTTVWPREQI